VAFNLGISNHPISRLGGLSSIGIYLYEDIYYRQWITEIALAYYEGRQDEFVWLDLVRQFRNPEKQQIIPLNLTKEIIDETSILYREPPIYQVTDSEGKILEEDQKLWEEIMRNSRYLMTMDKLDRWCRLLGTVLVKVSFVDPNTGELVNKTEGGQVQLDVLHGGVYDIRHGASPYYITELLIGFGTKFSGFKGSSQISGGSLTGSIPTDLGQASIEVKQQVDNPGRLQSINRIYWSPNMHYIDDDSGGNRYQTPNPYGIIPAVPFFDCDPAHYYFLPINEPLVYFNHATNMRITDLNHIAKFQSFGIPVVSGVERGTSLRHGRPVDDFNVLKGGDAQSRFQGIGGITGFGAGGQFRTFDAGLDIFRDGNADAAALGMTLGPDTAIAVGEKGDFKFAHPSADITGLIKVIHSMTDMVRINHGLRPKHDQSLPSSGFALLMEKIGVIEANVRRGRLFKEREQQLFQTIKRLWNTHNQKSGSRRFSDDAQLEITYVEPKFPVDPQVKMNTIILEQKIVESGDREAIGKLYPHLKDPEIDDLIKDNRDDRIEKAKFEAKVDVEKAKILAKAGIVDAKSSDKSTFEKSESTSEIKMEGKAESYAEKPKIDNRVKHSEDSSKQQKKNGDTRKSPMDK
jgi:hypothetical protein